MAKQNKVKKLGSGLFFWMLVILMAVFLAQMFTPASKPAELKYSDFKRYIRDGRIVEIAISEGKIDGTYVDDSGANKEFGVVPITDPNLVEELEEHNVAFHGKVEKHVFASILLNFGPILLFIVIWILIARQMRAGGQQAMTFGRSRTQIITKDKIKIGFDDVAGLDEAKEELQEIIEFLKNPKKFQRLGGKIPKGVLLYGLPGTGKTMLAKAVAGEAGVPFFSASGPEFVEMFVGVGASRIRDLFEKARKSSPAVIFIDELDAVGRHRFSGIGGGHDEREQTLNQLLIEMDGFDTTEGTILIAATNRPDVLDPALLRPGRFDRHIAVPVPDVKGREEILSVHTRKIKMAPEVNLNVLARRTPGFVGSDIANLANEAALLAARRNKDIVEMEDFEEAIDRVLAGPQRKSRVISEHEKKIIAFHEAGHTLVAKFMPGSDPIHKVSIIPRGPALGYTLQLPTEDRYLVSYDEIVTKITVLLGGRTAEELTFNQVTTGAQNDLEQATDIAYKIVSQYGMSKKIGPISLKKDEQEIFLGRDFLREKQYSEKTQQTIDEEVMTIIESAHHKATGILKERQPALDEIAAALLEKENLDGDEVDVIIKETLGIEPLVKARKSDEAQCQKGEKKLEEGENRQAKKD